MRNSLPGAPPKPLGHPQFAIVLCYLFWGLSQYAPSPSGDWWRTGGTIMTDDVIVTSFGDKLLKITLFFTWLKLGELRSLHQAIILPKDAV